MAWREKKACPLVIGGTGGSGTRVYKAIADVAGYTMLGIPWAIRFQRFQQHDNLLLDKFFFSQWVNRYVQGELTRFDKMRMRAACRLLLWMTGPLSYGRGRWGWKNPRTNFLIPFFQELYPTMKFIHVIRDGRDQAFHPRFHCRRHQACLLGAHEVKLEDHLRKALFWSRFHKLTEETASKHLKGRYIQSRLEDLCADPAGEAKKILAFLGADDSETVRRVVNLVERPASLGRWHTEPADKIAGIEELIGDDLTRYGYPLGCKPG